MFVRKPLIFNSTLKHSLSFSDAFSEISNIILHMAEYYIMFYEMHTPFSVKY